MYLNSKTRRASALADLKFQPMIGVPLGWSWTCSLRGHGYSQDKLSHPRVIMHLSAVSRRLYCEARHLRHNRRNHVLEHVAMENPLSCPVWRPAHIEALTLCDSLGDHHGTRVTAVGLDMAPTIERIHTVVETMQVQGMRLIGSVDPAPMHRPTDLVLEPLRIRPG